MSGLQTTQSGTCIMKQHCFKAAEYLFMSLEKTTLALPRVLFQYMYAAISMNDAITDMTVTHVDPTNKPSYLYTGCILDFVLLIQQF